MAVCKYIPTLLNKNPGGGDPPKFVSRFFSYIVPRCRMLGSLGADVLESRGLQGNAKWKDTKTQKWKRLAFMPTNCNFQLAGFRNQNIKNKLICRAKITKSQKQQQKIVAVSEICGRRNDFESIPCCRYLKRKYKKRIFPGPWSTSNKNEQQILGSRIESA